jgi:hypothetical protein
MLGTDIVQAVRAEVVEPNPAFFTSPTLLLWINNAQKAYVKRTRCLQNFATTSTVQGQADYPMPADWLAAEKVFYNFPVGGVDSWTPLRPTTIEKMAQESPNFLSSDPTQQGRPTKYYIVNQTLYLYPRPATTGVNDIYMFYESKPTALNALGDALSIDDSLSDGIEAYVLWKMWKMDGEDSLAEEQRQRFEQEIGNGLKWKKQRQLDGKWKIDIESFQPYSYGSANSSMSAQINPLNL